MWHSPLDTLQMLTACVRIWFRSIKRPLKYYILQWPSEYIWVEGYSCMKQKTWIICIMNSILFSCSLKFI